MGGKRASFPHPYHPKRDEKWGQLSHAHSFGAGSPTPVLTGLLHCAALVWVSLGRAGPAPRQGGTTEPTLLVKVWVCRAPRCKHERAAPFLIYLWQHGLRKEALHLFTNAWGGRRADPLVIRVGEPYSHQLQHLREQALRPTKAAQQIQPISGGAGEPLLK